MEPLLPNVLSAQSLMQHGGAAKPLPFVDDPAPYNGWIWQFYNLDNGEAFTGAGFVLNQMNFNLGFSYGYYLKALATKSWNAIYISGDMSLTDPQQFPALCNNPHDSILVTIPVSRAYAKLENISLLMVPLSGNAVP